jgi:diguanylate cyclase (GGDEF)-like protein/PAS domain S-box-containing protein
MTRKSPPHSEPNGREGEETFRLLFANHPIPMWIYDLKTLTFLEVNDATLDQYGYTREEFLGLTLKDIHPPEETARLQKVVKKTRPSLHYAGEWRHRHKDGRIIDVEINSHTLDFSGRKSVLVTAHDITKRKRAEDVLQESEAHYRALVEGTPVIVYSFSNKRGGIYYSEHVTDILGYSSEQLCAKPMLWRNSVHPDDLSSLDQRDLIAVAGKTMRVEYRIQDARGSWHWFDDRAFKYQNEDGEFIIEGRVLDITERKLADAALRESKERYHTLFNRMMDGIYRSTHDGRFVDVNPAMVRMFGYASREEMLAVDIKKELYFSASERGSHILDTGQEETEVYRMRRKDGSEIWVEDRGYYVHDALGNVLYHEGMLRDVTERKQVQDALADSEAELRALFASMQDTVLVIDRDGVYRRIAPTNPGRFYIPPDEVVGKRLMDLFPAEQTEKFLALIRQVLSTRQTQKIEYGITVNGQTPWFEASVSPMDEDCTIWVARDVTKRKQAEDELRHANKSLKSAHRELQQLFAHEQALARTDGLTGLYNRRYFFELAIREFNGTVRYQRPLTIILFDVDDFKQANDSFGHAMGDTILAQIAQAAAAQVRDVDVLARYGGDEFIILLPQTGAQQAFLIAERIRESVASTRVETDNSPFVVTLSIGVAEMVHFPQDQSVEDAIRRADQALYAAKQSGHNRTVIFRPG